MSFRKLDAPGLPASERARWDRGVAVAEAQGPAVEAALVELSRQIARDPSIRADADRFYALLGAALASRGPAAADRARPGGAARGPLIDADVEAVIFLVLMQAAKDAQEDLKAIMAHVKAINDAKAKQRALLAQMQRGGAAVADDDRGTGRRPRKP